MQRKSVDFHHIPVEQGPIHERLLNWARWCNGTQSKDCAPMFKGYTSNEVWAHHEATAAVDILDALRLEKAVCALPYNHKHALKWWYITATGPARTAAILGLTLEGLAMTVIQARSRVLTSCAITDIVRTTREPVA